jgi:hypothetical protein
MLKAWTAATKTIATTRTNPQTPRGLRVMSVLNRVRAPLLGKKSMAALVARQVSP